MALTDVKSEQIQSSVALAGSPTTTTQSASDNSTKIATTAYVETAVANLVASAPSALNTLDELAAALNDDASFSTTVTNSIATKLPLAGGTMSGALNMGSQNITNAGTIAGTIATAAQANITSVGTLTGLDIGSNSHTGANPAFGLTVDGANDYIAQFANTDATAGENHGVRILAGSNANDIAFQIKNKDNNTHFMHITGAGNVGIGENSPQGNLHVKSADSGATADGGANELVVEGSGNTGISILSGASSSGAIYFGDSGSAYDGYISYDQTNHKFNFATNSGPKMYLDTSGYLGIGVSPSTNLDIKTANIGSSSNFAAKAISVRLPFVSGYNNVIASGIGFYDNTIHSTDIGLAYNRGSSGGYDIVFSTNSTTSGSPVERMTIRADGNVGIGNTNPSAGKLVITASSNGSFGGNLILENSNASDTDKVAIALRPNGSATTALGSYGEIRIIGEYDSGSTNGASNLQFWTHSGNGTVAEAMRIGSTGHVAIGANPDLTKFIVEADHANWAGRFRNTNAGAYGLSVDLSQSSAAGGQANVYAFATYTPANTGLVVTKNGSVGIRTATPGSYGLNVLGNDNQVVIDGNGSLANSGLFFAEQGTNKWEVYHRGADDTFRIYNYATSSPNLQISAGGAVTHEKQPFSQGRGNGGWTSQTAAATWTKHPLTTPVMRSNRNSNYSTSNKRFTAPVAGVYLIQASWYAYYPGGGDSAGSQYMHPVIYINGAANWNSSYTPYTIYGHDIVGTSSHYLAPTLSLSVYLSANDYAEIHVYSRDSDLDFYENYSYFSYQLIG